MIWVVEPRNVYDKPRVLRLEPADDWERLGYTVTGPYVLHENDFSVTGDELDRAETAEARKSTLERRVTELLEAWDAWRSDSGFDDPWPKLKAAIEALR